jgi:Uncharacterised protein family (UPF0175)
MELTLKIPDDLTAPLREAHGDDLGRAAIERLALGGYRAGKLSRYQVQRLLGFDNRYDTEEWLGRNGAVSNYTVDDLHADRETLDRLLPRC